MTSHETTDAIAEERRADERRSNRDADPPAGSPGRRLLLFGAPILLGALFLIHPDGSGGLDALVSVADTWLFIHLAMLPLLGLLGASLYVLLEGYAGPVATVGRVGAGVYATFYVAFEAIAGVATGVVVHGAHAHPAGHRAGLAGAIDALVVPSVAIGAIGTLGALVAVVAAGVCLRRAGAPIAPVVLLGGLPLATLFHGGTPLDAVAIAAFLVGVAWLELGWAPTDGAPTDGESAGGGSTDGARPTRTADPSSRGT
mgnify:FL=1